MKPFNLEYLLKKSPQNKSSVFSNLLFANSAVKKI